MDASQLLGGACWPVPEAALPMQPTQAPAGSKKRARAAAHAGGGTAAYRGVSLHRCGTRYEAHVWKDNKQIYLGGSAVQSVAALAFDIASIHLRGACANLLPTKCGTRPASPTLVPALSLKPSPPALLAIFQQGSRPTPTCLSPTLPLSCGTKPRWVLQKHFRHCRMTQPALRDWPVCHIQPAGLCEKDASRLIERFDPPGPVCSLHSKSWCSRCAGGVLLWRAAECNMRWTRQTSKFTPPLHSCCHPPLRSCMKSMQALNPAPAFILANQLADWELEVSEAVSGAESLGVFATEREAAVRRAAQGRQARLSSAAPHRRRRQPSLRLSDMRQQPRTHRTSTHPRCPPLLPQRAADRGLLRRDGLAAAGLLNFPLVDYIELLGEFGLMRVGLSAGRAAGTQLHARHTGDCFVMSELGERQPLGPPWSDLRGSSTQVSTHPASLLAADPAQICQALQQGLLPQTVHRSWAPAAEPRPLKRARTMASAPDPCTDGLPPAPPATEHKTPEAGTAGERCGLAPPLPAPIPRRASTTPRPAPQPLLEDMPACFLC